VRESGVRSYRPNTKATVPSSLGKRVGGSFPGVCGTRNCLEQTYTNVAGSFKKKYSSHVSYILRTSRCFGTAVQSAPAKVTHLNCHRSNTTQLQPTDTGEDAFNTELATETAWW
jgi:hypothetical protein